MNQPASNLPNFRELSEQGERIYNTLDEDMRRQNVGRYIAIEFDSGEHFIADTRDEAVNRAKAKHPNKLVFVRRIGPIENISRHVMATERG